ncbi:hypothetical protein O9G_004564 [Rozella allomycis CSF55]|uniref:Uncharacterized protein n=1 Tax=Rozella allomycis (strain CSF55) TaxID=988480 RepID=A0A075AVA1_ROZAC|nr:hypothetical protein O9G_004564 [Rozella allomycis CSF55]|eukprot:EPZ32612.1 hypothetical protein O9G_004564 [Rozella allomycis CSF55]
MTKKNEHYMDKNPNVPRMHISKYYDKDPNVQHRSGKFDSYKNAVLSFIGELFTYPATNLPPDDEIPVKNYAPVEDEAIIPETASLQFHQTPQDVFGIKTVNKVIHEVSELSESSIQKHESHSDPYDQKSLQRNLRVGPNLLYQRDYQPDPSDIPAGRRDIGSVEDAKRSFHEKYGNDIFAVEIEGTSEKYVPSKIYRKKKGQSHADLTIENVQREE